MSDHDPRAGLPSASKLEITVSCPGQAALEKSLPPEATKPKEEEPDEMRDRGTRIHKCRETANTLELSEEEFELYKAGLEYERRMIADWAFAHALNEGDYREGPREERLWLHHPRTMEPIASGQLDVSWLSNDGRHVAILDWKTAYCTHLKPSPRSWQLRCLAILWWLDNPRVESIRVGFVKPMYPNSKPDYCEFSAQDLQYSYDSLQFHLWEATQEDLAKRRPGEHCTYCPCKAHCPEAAAYALLPSVIAGKAMTPEESVQQLVGADLLKLWMMNSVVDKIFKAVTARLKRMSKEELANLGLELDEGKNLDPIVLTHKYFVHLRDEKAWSETDIFKCLTFSKGDLADVFALDGGLSKKDATAAVKADAEPYVEKKKSAPSLRQI